MRGDDDTRDSEIGNAFLQIIPTEKDMQIRQQGNDETFIRFILNNNSIINFLFIYLKLKTEKS